jgi:hypothetical protein
MRITPDGIANVATVVNIPTGLVNLVILSAAIVAAPSIGKNLSSVTVAQLKLARDNLLFFNKSDSAISASDQHACRQRQPTLR